MAVVVLIVAPAVPRSAESDQVERQINPGSAADAAAGQMVRMGGESQMAFAEFTLTHGTESVHELFVGDSHSRSS